jgi:hypothetical protein
MDTTMNKGYIEKDDNNNLTFNEFATGCPPVYNPSLHTDMTDCESINIIKHFTTTKVQGYPKEYGETPANIYFNLHSKTLLGFIENLDDPNNNRNQHFIFGRISDHKDSIVGVVAGEGEFNNGHFYAKRLPNYLSYPIYDHVNGATFSYPYDTMTTLGKDIKLNMYDINIDFYMEN